MIDIVKSFFKVSKSVNRFGKGRQKFGNKDIKLGTMKIGHCSRCRFFCVGKFAVSAVYFLDTLKIGTKLISRLDKSLDIIGRLKASAVIAFKVVGKIFEQFFDRIFLYLFIAVADRSIEIFDRCRKVARIDLGCVMIKSGKRDGIGIDRSAEASV